MMEIHEGARVIFPVAAEMGGLDATGVVLAYDGDMVTVRLDEGGGEYRTPAEVTEVLEPAPTDTRTTITITPAGAGQGIPLVPGQRQALPESPDVDVARSVLSHPRVVAHFGPDATGLIILDRDTAPPAGTPAVRLRLVGKLHGTTSEHQYYRAPETPGDAAMIDQYPDDLAKVDHFDQAYEHDQECGVCGLELLVWMIAWMRGGGHRRYMSCHCGTSWEKS